MTGYNYVFKVTYASYQNNAGYYLIEGPNHTVFGTPDMSTCNRRGKLVSVTLNWAHAYDPTTSQRNGHRVRIPNKEITSKNLSPFFFERGISIWKDQRSSLCQECGFRLVPCHRRQRWSLYDGKTWKVLCNTEWPNVAYTNMIYASTSGSEFLTAFLFPCNRAVCSALWRVNIWAEFQSISSRFGFASSSNIKF